MKQPATLSTWPARPEQLPLDWERPLGALMLMLGVGGLVLDVMTLGAPPGQPWNTPALYGALFVAIIPIGLWLVQFAVSRLRTHHDRRMRWLANSAAALPGQVVTTRAGRRVTLLLGVAVAFGATSWDLLLTGGHPRAALIVLGASLVGACGVTLCAIAAFRTAGAARASGAYLLGGLTIGILLLGGASHRAPVPQINAGMHYRHINPGGRPMWVTHSARAARVAHPWTP